MREQKKKFENQDNRTDNELMTVHAVSKLTGITVRTLHYYDEIGLLSPSGVKENGYRYYDKAALQKLQEIMFYRELDFPLKDIQAIVNTTEFPRSQALIKQKELLIIRKKRIDHLISLLDENLKGEKMDFNAFDNSELESKKEEYAKEVKEKWGKTKAYSQYSEKIKSYQKKDYDSVNQMMQQLITEFANLKNDEPGSEPVQKQVVKWQAFITEYYYDCTDEILSGLGKMYLADERFKKNIDKCGEGTAEFISKAIEIYCNRLK